MWNPLRSQVFMQGIVAHYLVVKCISPTQRQANPGAHESTKDKNHILCANWDLLEVEEDFIFIGSIIHHFVVATFLHQHWGVWEKLWGLEKEEARKKSHGKENKREGGAVDHWREAMGTSERTLREEKRESCFISSKMYIVFSPRIVSEIGMCLTIDGLWVLVLAKWRFWCNCHCMYMSSASGVPVAVISSVYTLGRSSKEQCQNLQDWCPWFEWQFWSNIETLLMAEKWYCEEKF